MKIHPQVSVNGIAQTILCLVAIKNSIKSNLYHGPFSSPYVFHKTNHIRFDENTAVWLYTCISLHNGQVNFDEWYRQPINK